MQFMLTAGHNIPAHVLLTSLWLLSPGQLKAELEAEYLALFRKTVAQHEAFLQRLTSHNLLRGERNLQVNFTQICCKAARR